MVVASRADLVGCLIARLRSFSELTALVGGASPRISARLQDAWAMPTGAVLLRKVGGPNPGDEYMMGRKATRIDVFCYGSTGYEADRVWGKVDPILVPEQGSGRSACFRLNGVRVDDIVPESDAISTIEQQTNWPRVSASYIVRWWSLPS